MITVPTNDGGLTCLGRFAGTLPVDMQLGQLISYGIALGVGTEGDDCSPRSDPCSLPLSYPCPTPILPYHYPTTILPYPLTDVYPSLVRVHLATPNLTPH